MKGKQDDYIEEKALELNNEILLESHEGNYFDMAKDFLRNLLSQAPMRKAKVNKDWISELIDVCEDVREGEMPIEHLYEKLEEAGVEVEDK